MPQIQLRPMRTEDIPEVYQIETLCFSMPWSMQSFHDEITKNHCARYLVLVEDGVVVTYGGMWLIIDEAHVNNIATHPDFQRRGYGQRILCAMMRDAYRILGITVMSLEVRPSNTTAIRLNERLGFVEVGRRLRYYEDNNEDALIMRCENTLETLTNGVSHET